MIMGWILLVVITILTLACFIGAFCCRDCLSAVALLFAGFLCVLMDLLILWALGIVRL